MKLEKLVELAASNPENTSKVLGMMTGQMEETNRAIEHINGQMAKLSEFIQNNMKQNNENKAEVQTQLADLNKEIDILKTWNDDSEDLEDINDEDLEELVMEENKEANETQNQIHIPRGPVSTPEQVVEKMAKLQQRRTPLPRKEG